MCWKKFTTLMVALVFTQLIGCSKNPADNNEPNNIIGDLNLPPVINIVGLEPGDDNVSGTANNLDINKIQVVLWAKTDKWYVQPWIVSPYTQIATDGTWENNTNPWDNMLALLVDSTYEPGSTRTYHPSVDPGVVAWDEYPSSSTNIIGDLNLPPVINIVGLEPGDIYVQGTANNLDLNKIRIVLWAKTDIWYVQPSIIMPYTQIQTDGTWGSDTHSWYNLLALLVDSTYVPGSTRIYHPSSDLGVVAWDEYPSSSVERIINFSGYAWKVKDAILAGPGPNYFSNDPENVWVDSQGYLHLKVTYREEHWYCGEIFLDHSLGYGQYTYQVISRIDSLDYNEVFSGYTYESPGHEIDIEFSRFLANPNNAQFVVQPYYNPGNLMTFPLPAVQNTTHRFCWSADSISFSSWQGLAADYDSTTLIKSWNYTGADIPPPGDERMRFNLWLFGGNSPQNGQGDEVIVKTFGFQL